MSPDTAEPVVTTTRPKPRADSDVKLLPPYHVIILNDEDHSFEFVVQVLCEVFKVTIPQSFQFTLEAHEKGRAIVWTGPKEVAELKAEQVSTFHEIRPRDGAKLGPVGCVIEPAPN